MIKEITRRTLLGCVASSAALFPSVTRAQEDEVRVGVITDLSGEFAQIGKTYQQAIQIYLDQIGGKVDGRPVRFIYRDGGGFNTARVRQVAQELVVREKVHLLTGIDTTPAALTAIEVVKEAKIPLVVFNSSLSSIVRRSPYVMRTGITLWEGGPPLASYAFQLGLKTAVIAVADFSAGLDAADAYSYGFKAAGGEVRDVVKIPVDATDYSSYVQRIKDLKADCTLVFMPAGPQSLGLTKAYLAAGTMPQFFGFNEARDVDLPLLGDQAVGIITSQNYQTSLDNPENIAFLKALATKFGSDAVPPDFLTAAAYAGMTPIVELIRAGVSTDPLKAMEAVKSLKWHALQGPVSFNPDTRDIVQNIYIRRVEKGQDGKLYHKVVKTVESVKDLWLETHS